MVCIEKMLCNICALPQVLKYSTRLRFIKVYNKIFNYLVYNIICSIRELAVK